MDNERTPGALGSNAELGLVERLRQRGNALRCHPAANGTVGHTEEAGELLVAAATEIERLRAELQRVQDYIDETPELFEALGPLAHGPDGV